MTLPQDYAERVYAGVLGKIIGVYLGRPVENRTYDWIAEAIGEIGGFLQGRHDLPLKTQTIVVPDDDISGTFTFLRALEDEPVHLHMHGDERGSLSAASIGEAWLNYLIERQTVLWWGGMGVSTEHTAYIRLKHGLVPPASGAIATNGRLVAEQIGAQIFIDGWAMVAPGDPELAAELARKAASVSHDGMALHAAQLIAAMEAQAFVESDMDCLFDTGLRVIPVNSTIRRVIDDVRAWHAQYTDWRTTFQRILTTYGYDRYGGGCHVVPNHAIVAMALAYGRDDFSRAILVATNAGWDTDCNAANVGALMGIKNGLTGIDASSYDWRTTVADRMYLPTADGGRCVTDAVQQAQRVVQLGTRLMNGTHTVSETPAPRFSFAFPGSTQGFTVLSGAAVLSNIASVDGYRLNVACQPGETVITTPTFIPPEIRSFTTYRAAASPTLYPGQTVMACVCSDLPVTVRLCATAERTDGSTLRLRGEPQQLKPKEMTSLRWPIPSGSPLLLTTVGFSIAAVALANVQVQLLDWRGPPDVIFRTPDDGDSAWQRAWVSSCSDTHFGRFGKPHRIAQDAGVGLLMQGEETWTNYRARAHIIPYMAKAAGVALYVHNLRQYYVLQLSDNQTIQLIRRHNQHVTVLAETAYLWETDVPVELALACADGVLTGTIDGKQVVRAVDTHPLKGGAIALLVDTGHLAWESIAVQPLGKEVAR